MSNSGVHGSDVHHHTIMIDGVSIDFPKEPYPCQVEYMKGVIRALNSGSNALLESPTGTGKTLCLLCATLAWQSKHKPRNMELGYEANDHTINMHPNIPKVAPSTIVYATRTHSQLAQIVQELRSTSYQPRMTVLGSREQLCIHEKVSKLKNGVINHACNSLNSKRACMYKNNLDGYMDSGASIDNTSSLDIEDMVKLGRTRKICPYFHSREFSASADIVFLPYNYLLDSAIRKTVRIEWEKCIVIFDEAHNLERVAADAASFSLSSTDLALCIQEVQNVLRSLVDAESSSTLSRKHSEPHRSSIHDPSTTGSNGSSTVTATDLSSGVQRPQKTIVMVVLKAMFDLEMKIDQLNTSSSLGKSNEQQDLNGLVFPGRWLIQLLKAVGLRTEHVDELRKCSNMLLEEAQDAMSGLGDGGSSSSSSSIPIVEPKLSSFAQALDRVYRSEMGHFTDDYKVYVCTEEVKSGSNHFSSSSSNSSHNNSSGSKNQYSNNHSYHNSNSNRLPFSGVVKAKKIINYWCFSTGVAMNELKKLGVKSILLTSGTLSPMPALREDLKLPFSVQLENPHVISDKQMWVAAVPVGATGKQLNSTFHCRDTTAYKTELGETVLRICLSMYSKDHLFNSTSNNTSNSNSGSSRSSGRDSDAWSAYGVVATTAPPTRPSPPPCVKGGVLVFFPSYSVMDSSISHWKQIGIYDKLKNIVGNVISESRASVGISSSSSSSGISSSGSSSNSQSSSFMTTKAKTVTAVDNASQLDQEFNSVVSEFNQSIDRYGGCVLMAVCRGKVSEGIDFADSKGRVVIITGIPYAPFKDPWIVLKKKYLDEKCAVAKGVPAVPPPSNGASAHHYSNSSIGIGMSHYHMIEQGRGQHMNPVGTILNVINNYQVATSSTSTSTTKTPAVNSIHATSGKENIWQTAATLALSASNKDAFSAVTSASLASSYPPAMPPPQPIVALSSIQSGHSLPPPVGMMKRIDHSASASAAFHTLTGQGWYVQSAGRAVNQCIGRVIRHNRDWGTVFLLDDRFSSDAQLSQLSQWIRPRVKKYKGFNEAIKDFRSYLTAVVQDPSLNAFKKITGNIVAASSHRVSAASRSDRSGDSLMKGSDGGDDGGGFMFFKRHVVIKRDALDGTDDDNTFIDPSFLATQQSVGDVHGTTGSSIDVIDNTHRSIQYQKQYLKHQQHNDESSSAVGVNKLMDTMNQLRSKPSILSDKDSINNSNKGILSSGAIDSFLIKTQQKQSSFGLQSSSSTSLSSSSILMKTEKTIAASSSSSSSSSTQNRKMCDQSESSSSSSQASFQLSQAPFHLSQSSSSSHHKISHSQLSRSSSNHLDSNKMDFNELIGLLRPYYETNEMGELKLKLKYLRTVKSTSALRQCLGDLMRFMRVVVDVELRIDALRSFTTLLAKDIREEYIMMVEDECGRIDISISDDDGDDDDLVDDDNCYDDDGNDDDNDDDSGGKCHDRDERDIILDDDDDDDKDMKHRSIKSCRSILGEKRRRRTSSSHLPHDAEKHLQSIITETKRKGTELEGTELLSSMMVDRGSRGSHGSDSHTEGGNPRSVASKRAKMIFGSSLQSKSIINTIAKPQSHLPIKMEHNNNKSSNNSSSSSNKSTVNSIINENIRHDISSTVSIKKSTSTTLKPTSLLDIDRLASSAIDPPSKSSSASSSSSQASSSMQANRFKCGVCTERPSLPCAGRCGHICCQACWVKWLQINATCPMCRAPADKNSVTRLIMKA